MPSHSFYEFPSPENADSQGLLVYGGDLSANRLLAAYYRGIFPWFSVGDPILWWSPDPRMVLFPENLHISKSMQRLCRQAPFTVTYDKAFDRVIDRCANIKRPGQTDTWITPAMKGAYRQLHRLGYARSVEVWDHNHHLVGGLYGIYLKDKHLFCGESMFTTVSNASKYGFIHAVKKLQKEGVNLIDCQVYSDHLASLGAEEISRSVFLQFLEE